MPEGRTVIPARFVGHKLRGALLSLRSVYQLFKIMSLRFNRRFGTMSSTAVGGENCLQVLA